MLKLAETQLQRNGPRTIVHGVVNRYARAQIAEPEARPGLKRFALKR